MTITKKLLCEFLSVLLMIVIFICFGMPAMSANAAAVGSIADGEPIGANPITASCAIAGTAKSGSAVVVVVDLTNNAQSTQAMLFAGVYDGSSRLVGAASKVLTLPAGPSSQVITINCLDQANTQKVKVFLLDSQSQLHPIAEIAEASVTAGGSISGNVYNCNTTLISGATVVLKDGEATINTTVSGADGHYLLSGIPLGTYTLEVSADEYHTDISTVRLTSASGLTDNHVHLYKTVNFGSVSYDIGDVIYVFVMDKDLNINPTAADTGLVTVSSTTDAAGITIPLLELNGRNSVLFGGALRLTQSNEPGCLPAKPGDMLTLTYNKVTANGTVSYSTAVSVNTTIAVRLDSVAATDSTATVTLSAVPVGPATANDFQLRYGVEGGVFYPLTITNFSYDGNLSATITFTPIARWAWTQVFIFGVTYKGYETKDTSISLPGTNPAVDTDHYAYVINANPTWFFFGDRPPTYGYDVWVDGIYTTLRSKSGTLFSSGQSGLYWVGYDKNGYCIAASVSEFIHCPSSDGTVTHVGTNSFTYMDTASSEVTVQTTAGTSYFLVDSASYFNPVSYMLYVPIAESTDSVRYTILYYLIDSSGAAIQVFYTRSVT